MDSEGTVHNYGYCAQGILTETLRNLITPPWTLCSFGTRVHKFWNAQNCPRNFKLFDTRNFKIRHFMAQLCRADSQHRVLNTIEFLHCHCSCMIRYTFKLVTGITFQTRDGSRASEFPLTSLMVCNSFKLLMDSVLFEFMCFPVFDVVHFPRFLCGSSYTDTYNTQ